VQVNIYVGQKYTIEISPLVKQYRDRPSLVHLPAFGIAPDPLLMSQGATGMQAIGLNLI